MAVASAQRSDGACAHPPLTYGTYAYCITLGNLACDLSKSPGVKRTQSRIGPLVYSMEERLSHNWDRYPSQTAPFDLEDHITLPRIGTFGCLA